MVDRIALRKCIKERHANAMFLAQSLGITKASLTNKLNGVTEFKESEMMTLAQVLQLDMQQRNDIFFA